MRASPLRGGPRGCRAGLLAKRAHGIAALSRGVSVAFGARIRTATAAATGLGQLSQVTPTTNDSQEICATNPRIVMICAPPTRDRGMRLARARPSWWRRANSLGAQRALHAAIAAGDATRSSAVAAAAAPCGARCSARRRLCLPKRCRVVSGCFPVPAGTYPAPDALVCNWRRGRGQRAHMCSTRDRAGTRGYRVVPARHGVSARGFRRCPRQTRKASSLSHEDSFTSRKLPRLV
jgi:hypothetical protein